MKVKIIRLSKDDYHYGSRKDLIGLIGNCKILNEHENGWKGFIFYPKKKYNPFHFSPICFYKAKFEVLEK